MLAIQQNKPVKLTAEQIKELNPEDVIILKKDKMIITENADGSTTYKQTYKKVNLTKLTNETAKMLKIDVANEKLNELKQTLEKAENLSKELKK